MEKIRVFGFWIAVLIFAFCILNSVYATPSTHIWAPSTDIQPYKKVHITADYYFPTTKKDSSDNRIHAGQVYGPTFSLLSDKPEENFLGKLWDPLGKVMAEAGFDYKKGYGPALDTYPLYFHFKFGIPEDAHFKYAPAFALGGYDFGTKKGGETKTNNNIWYFKAAKTVSLGKLSLGRFSAGGFWGNGKLLRNVDGSRHSHKGSLLAWERTMSEISDKLWLCVDYQGSKSGYGAMNYGFAWSLTKDISFIVGYDIYNNRNLTDTVTFQLDWNF